MQEWPFKDPDETLDYEVKWGNRIPTGDPIASETFTVISGSVQIDHSVFDGTANTSTVWLKGGTLAESCIIRASVTTTQGRILDQYVKIKIKQRD